MCTDPLAGRLKKTSGERGCSTRAKAFMLEVGLIRPMRNSIIFVTTDPNTFWRLLPHARVRVSASSYRHYSHGQNRQLFTTSKAKTGQKPPASAHNKDIYASNSHPSKKPEAAVL